jgi:hypothetical protein
VRHGTIETAVHKTFCLSLEDTYRVYFRQGSKRTPQTSYDGADGFAGLAVSHLVFVGRTVDSNVDLRREFWAAMMGVREVTRLQPLADQIRKLFEKRAHKAREGEPYQQLGSGTALECLFIINDLLIAIITVILAIS